MPNEDHKWEFGLWAVLMGVVGLVTAFALVAFKWHDQAGIGALGTIASPIVAIVSAYFGIQYSQKAAQNAAEVTKDATAKVGAAEMRRSQDVEVLRKELIPSLAEGAMADAMTAPEAQGFAAKAWDDARSAMRE